MGSLLRLDRAWRVPSLLFSAASGNNRRIVLADCRMAERMVRAITGGEFW